MKKSDFIKWWREYFKDVSQGGLKEFQARNAIWAYFVVAQEKEKDDEINKMMDDMYKNRKQ